MVDIKAEIEQSDRAQVEAEQDVEEQKIRVAVNEEKIGKLAQLANQVDQSLENEISKLSLIQSKLNQEKETIRELNHDMEIFKQCTQRLEGNQKILDENLKSWTKTNDDEKDITVRLLK